jgi:hypothetical protein
MPGLKQNCDKKTENIFQKKKEKNKIYNNNKKLKKIENEQQKKRETYKKYNSKKKTKEEKKLQEKKETYKKYNIKKKPKKEKEDQEKNKEKKKESNNKRQKKTKKHQVSDDTREGDESSDQQKQQKKRLTDIKLSDIAQLREQFKNIEDLSNDITTELDKTIQSHLTQLNIPKITNEDMIKCMKLSIESLSDHIEEYHKGKETQMPNTTIHTQENMNETDTTFIEQTHCFEKEMFNVQFNTCTMCHQTKLNFPINEKKMCKRCIKDPIKFGHENRALPTWIDKFGKIQYKMPRVLKNLSIAEKLLIQKVSPIVPVIHIRNGSLGSRGHCVSFFQDIENICTIFPRLPSQVTIVKVIRKATDKQGNLINQSFTVNRKNVLMALKFLKEHNILYQNITIQEENFSWMKDKENCILDSIVTVVSNETEDEDPDR